MWVKLQNCFNARITKIPLAFPFSSPVRSSQDARLYRLKSKATRRSLLEHLVVRSKLPLYLIFMVYKI